MRLDHLRRPPHRARFDHVGIKRALHQPLHVAFYFLDAPRFPFEDLDEFVADDLPFLLRIADSFQFVQKAIGRVDGVEIQAKLVVQRLLYFLKFILAQHAIVHEDAGEA